MLSSRTAAPLVSRKGFCCGAAFAPDGWGDASRDGAVCACCGGVACSAATTGFVACAVAACCAGCDCGGGDGCVACAGGPSGWAGATIVATADCCWDVLEPDAVGLGV